MNKFLTLAKNTALDAGQLLKKRYKSLLEVEFNKRSETSKRSWIEVDYI